MLARELHIREIEEIKKQVPDMELEIFVHGAMCMSYS
ncbi:U32 family peptidase [bacterium]|nr:U32 family peptidase [bacterium]